MIAPNICMNQTQCLGYREMKMTCTLIIAYVQTLYTQRTKHICLGRHMQLGRSSKKTALCILYNSRRFIHIPFLCLCGSSQQNRASFHHQNTQLLKSSPLYASLFIFFSLYFRVIIHIQFSTHVCVDMLTARHTIQEIVVVLSQLSCKVLIAPVSLHNRHNIWDIFHTCSFRMFSKCPRYTFALESFSDFAMHHGYNLGYIILLISDCFKGMSYR